MLDLRVVLVLGLGAAGLFLARGLWTTPEVEFTRAAPPAPASFEMRPPLSTVHVDLPVDLGRVVRRTEAALLQRLTMGLDTSDACTGRRAATGGTDCGPRLDGAVSLAGPVSASVDERAVRVRLPLRLDIAQGQERTSVEPTLSFVFRVRAEPGAGFEISRVDEPVEISPGPHVRTVRVLESRLRPLALTAQDELRAVLSDLPLTESVAGAWQALARPLELGAGAGAWIQAAPEVVGAGVLASMAGQPVVRIPIAARIAIESRVPASPSPRRAVVHGQVATGGGSSVRVAVPLALDGVQRAVEDAFVRDGPHETRADRFGPPVKVDVRRTRLYPSNRQLAVELDLAASRFEGETFRGKAHLVGRPVLDASERTVALADITFPLVPRDAAAPRTVPGAPRLAAEPLAARLAAVTRIDVSADLAEAAPRTSRLLNRRLDDRIAIAASLDSATPAAIEVTRDGLWLLTDVTGTLSLTYDRNGMALAAHTATRVSERANETTSTPAARVATPDLTAAAVVTAASVAAAGGQAAARATASPQGQTARVTAASADPSPVGSPASPQTNAPSLQPTTGPAGMSPAPAPSGAAARIKPKRITAHRSAKAQEGASAPRRSGEWVRSTFGN